MRLTAIVAIALTLATARAIAEQQRFYAPDGRSIGTAVPQGEGSTRYYEFPRQFPRHVDHERQHDPLL